MHVQPYTHISIVSEKLNIDINMKYWRQEVVRLVVAREDAKERVEQLVQDRFLRGTIFHRFSPGFDPGNDTHWQAI